MKRVGRALFFRTGINELVRVEVDRQQQRDKETRAKLEQQVQELRKSTEVSAKELRQLNRRYADLNEKYNAAMKLLDRRHEQLGRVVDDVHGLKKEHLSGRLTALEDARQNDQAEPSLEARSPPRSSATPISSISARHRFQRRHERRFDGTHPSERD